MTGINIQGLKPSTAIPPWSYLVFDGWGWATLAELCGIFDCPHSTPKVVADGPYLMARTPDVQGGVFRAEHARRVSKDTYYDRVRRAEPSPGDLLYSREGTYFGTAAEVPPGVKVCLGQRMVLIRPDGDVCHSGFLRHWLNSPMMQSHIHGHRDGSVAERLNVPTIRSLPVALPPIDEQRRIAAVLGALDDKIELNRKMNRTLEEMAQALFKSWFIDFDGHEDLVDSELGPIPRGWTVEPLDQVADFLNGAACQKYSAAEGEESLPVIKIRELNQGISDNTDRATASIPSKWHVSDGDVLFSWSGSLVVIIWTGGPGALNQHLFKVTSERFPRWFFYLWTKHHLREFQRIAADKATTMGHIKRHHLTDAMCVVPPSAVFEEYHRALDPIIQRQVNTKLESRTLANLRDLLLPKLISGELRVPKSLNLTPSP